MRNYTQAEIDTLTDKYATTSTKELCLLLGKNELCIYNKAFKLGLKKNREFLSAEISERIRKGEQKVGVETQFKKGNIPANKGKKMPEHVYEIASKTMFKKGNEPHNTKEDGCISVRKDKRGVDNKFIRIAKSNWIPLHHYVWMKVNGEIPKGSVLIFKDGNPMNCELNNIKCITKADNARRNSVMRYPEEIRKTIRTKAVLTRFINQINK